MNFAKLRQQTRTRRFEREVLGYEYERLPIPVDASGYFLDLSVPWYEAKWVRRLPTLADMHDWGVRGRSRTLWTSAFEVWKIKRHKRAPVVIEYDRATGRWKPYGTVDWRNGK